jgi:hypothetical protein
MSQWEEKLAITEAVQNWAFARDFGNWNRLRAVFHPDGIMTSTRFTGPAEDFIAFAAKNRTSRSTHFMGGTSVRLNGNKAIAESRMILMSRTTLDGIEVDVTCYGRFYDRFVKHEGAWRILRRNAIYEKDRIEPVRPGAVLKLNEAELARFPEGYRYLAYVQSKSGSTVDLGLPTPRSAALEQLYKEGTAWLEVKA